MAKGRSDAFDERFGKAMTFYRLQAGLSRQELGEQSGVSHQQISKYERGTNRVCLSRAARIADVLQVPLLRMFEMAGWQEKQLPDRTTSSMLHGLQRIQCPTVKRQLAKLIAALADGGPKPN